MRFSDMGRLHRNERSGTLTGLFRVRQFTQDDAHIYCRLDQLQDEIRDLLVLVSEWYKTFGLEAFFKLSTRPPKSIGTDAQWESAERALHDALRGNGLAYDLNPGDGAFYGPKIDLHMTDSIGRAWQLGTVQLDYSMPERFDLQYTGADNAEHRPVMIHRALMGSFERFIGILIEHYAAEFPLWLAPIQAIALPIADRHVAAAQGVVERLLDAGLRAELDDRSESVGRKIRDAELRKIPYMLVVGDREAAEGAVALRAHRTGDLGAVPVEELVARLVQESDAHGQAAPGAPPLAVTRNADDAPTLT
jgi:threonyl-tRNA synthetase